MANLTGSAPEALVAAFTTNKTNLQQAKLEWRFNERFTDPQWATAYVGAALLSQQEKAAKRYEKEAVATRAAIEEQTRQGADQARILKSTIEESSEAVRKEVANVQTAVQANTNELRGIASQVSQLAWLQAEQNHTLQQIFSLIRDSRANECRQLVEQGERNFKAGYIAEAEERFKLALTYDSTDYMTHQHLGLTYIRLGRPDAALEHFLKACAFPPRAGAAEQRFFVARAATHAARTCYAMGDYAQAEKHLVNALSVEKGNTKNAYDLSVMRTYQDKTAEAIEALSTALDGDPTLAGAALADEELAPLREEIEILILERTADAFDVAQKAIRDLEHLQKQLGEIAQRVGVPIDTTADTRPIIARVQKKGPNLLVAKEAVRGIADLRRALRDRALQTLSAARARVTADATQSRDDRSREKEDVDLQLARRESALIVAVRNSAPSFDATVMCAIVFAVVGAFAGAAVLHGCSGGLLGAAGGAVAGAIAYRAYAATRVARAREALEQFTSERTAIQTRYNGALESERAVGVTRAQDLDQAIATVRAIQ